MNATLTSSPPDQRPLVEGEVGDSMMASPSETGLSLLKKLKVAATELNNEYKMMDTKNVEAGGEPGEILISEMDEGIMTLVTLLRECFSLGLNTKTGFFNNATKNPLLQLLSEITLKSAFQEILALPIEVDPIFETDVFHLEAAWFIMALNELALPQYVEIIRQNPELANKFYNQEGSVIMSDVMAAELVDIMHEIENVYFQIDFGSYAAYIKRQQVAIISVSSPSLASLNQSAASLKIHNSSTEERVDNILSSSPFPESNGSSKVSDQHGFLSTNASTGETQSLRSHTSSPRKSSPLKDSITADDEELVHDAMDDTYEEPLKTSDTLSVTFVPNDDEVSANIKKSTAPVSLDSIAESEDEAEAELEQTSETCTTSMYFSSSQTTLTSLTDEVLPEDISEAASTTRSSTSATSELGFFGLSIPNIIHGKSSLLSGALGYLGPHFSHQNSTHHISTVPGDFETIERIAEKEKLKLSCSGNEIEMRICPIEGLASQHFRCRDCQAVIGINDYPQAKLCEVSGNYYCPECHQDDLTHSPALIIKNWDFRKVPVSKSMYSLLGSQCRSELFDVEKWNSDLFNYVSELQEIKSMRQRLIMYSEVFMLCTQEERLDILRRVWPKEHLIETINLYTIEDLLETREGKLQYEMKNYLKLIEEHVTKSCKMCKEAYSDRK